MLVSDWQCRLGRFDLCQAVPAPRGHAAILGGRGRKIRELGGIEKQLGVAAGQHHDELVDISVAATETSRQRKWYGPQPSGNCTEEAGCELRTRFRDQCQPVTLFKAERQKAMGMA